MNTQVIVKVEPQGANRRIVHTASLPVLRKSEQFGRESRLLVWSTFLYNRLLKGPVVPENTLPPFSLRGLDSPYQYQLQADTIDPSMDMRTPGWYYIGFMVNPSPGSITFYLSKATSCVYEERIGMIAPMIGTTYASFFIPQSSRRFHEAWNHLTRTAAILKSQHRLSETVRIPSRCAFKNCSSSCNTSLSPRSKHSTTTRR